MITSKKRKVRFWDDESKEMIVREIYVWNETVANLTLLALGSSAPEILLSTIETVTDLASETTKKNSLGFYTIIGSASFNLLLITAICIVSLPSPTTKSIKELGKCYS